MRVSASLREREGREGELQDSERYQLSVLHAKPQGKKEQHKASETPRNSAPRDHDADDDETHTRSIKYSTEEIT